MNYEARKLQRAYGAVVGGVLTREEPASARHDRDDDSERSSRWDHRWMSSGSSWLGLGMSFLGLLAAGAVFVLVFPNFTAQAPLRIRASPWLSLAVGFGVLVGVPVLPAQCLATATG